MTLLESPRQEFKAGAGGHRAAGGVVCIKRSRRTRSNPPFHADLIACIYGRYAGSLDRTIAFCGIRCAVFPAPQLNVTEKRRPVQTHIQPTLPRIPLPPRQGDICHLCANLLIPRSRGSSREEAPLLGRYPGQLQGDQYNPLPRLTGRYWPALRMAAAQLSTVSLGPMLDQ